MQRARERGGSTWKAGRVDSWRRITNIVVGTKELSDGPGAYIVNGKAATTRLGGERGAGAGFRSTGESMATQAADALAGNGKQTS